jgi:hypothetical protein
MAKLERTFAENMQKFQKHLHVVQLLMIPHCLLGNITNSFCSWIKFSSRKLQNIIHSVPSQAYEPVDDTDKDEYIMAGGIIDADLGARDTSSETQAEIEGAAQKDACRPIYKAT